MRDNNLLLQGLCCDGPYNGKILEHTAPVFHVAKTPVLFVASSQGIEVTKIVTGEYHFVHGIWKWSGWRTTS
jgi:hypothetical protein